MIAYIRPARPIAGLFALAALAAAGPSAHAGTIQSVSASPFTGPTQTKPGAGAPGGNFRPFDTTADLAYSGGLALDAVTKDTIFGFPTIHNPTFLNDGNYGNGASWIGASANSWLKVDLGQVALIDSILFGRDRLGNFDDRDPGRFTVEVALNDAIYLNGNDANDASEYTLVFDSSSVGYSGAVNGTQTLRAVFTAPVSARFVKVTFANNGAAIDELEVHGTAAPSAVPEPASWLMLGLGTVLVAGVGRFRNRSSLRAA